MRECQATRFVVVVVVLVTQSKQTHATLVSLALAPTHFRPVKLASPWHCARLSLKSDSDSNSSLDHISSAKIFQLVHFISIDFQTPRASLASGMPINVLAVSENFELLFQFQFWFQSQSWIVSVSVSVSVPI